MSDERCPFCGKEPQRHPHNDAEVRCLAHTDWMFRDEWNRRAPSPAQPDVDAGADVLLQMDATWSVKEACDAVEAILRAALAAPRADDGIPTEAMLAAGARAWTEHAEDVRERVDIDRTLSAVWRAMEGARK